jgi:hypothetical protein
MTSSTSSTSSQEQLGDLTRRTQESFKNLWQQ